MTDRRDDEDYRRYREMAEALANVAAILVRVRDTGLLSQRIVDEVRRMFGSLGAVLCRVDPQSSGLRAMAVAGDIGAEDDGHVTCAVGMGIPGRDFTEQHPIITADILADPHIRLAPEMRAIVERAPYRAVLAVPLVLDDVIIGTLCILDRRGRLFTSEEARFAQTVARQAALALDNARLSEEAEAARAAAMAANQAKDDFLATLSHELRNPLNAMFGWTRMLRTRRLDEQRVGHALEAIERNVVIQSQLIHDLLDVSRITAGKMELVTRAVVLPPLIEQAVDSLRHEAEAKQIGLQLVVESADAVVVSGDPLRLHQVIANLVTNAIKFTPPGGRIEVRIARVAGGARLSVTDNGAGIAADALPHVFERFRQGDQHTSRTHGGLGLGLAIVHRIVTLHGGTAVAESAGRGRGAKFTVDIPFMAASDRPSEEHGAGALPEMIPARRPVLTGTRVLVVDDHQDTRELIGTVLEHCGAKVTTTGSVAAALEILDETRIDVLISDLGIPVLDGYDLIHRLRGIERARRRPETPAVALSGFASREDRQRALSAGYHFHEAKPVEPDRLAWLVAEAAKRSPAGESRTGGMELEAAR